MCGGGGEPEMHRTDTLALPIVVYDKVFTPDGGNSVEIFLNLKSVDRRPLFVSVCL
jgi:hypothetical protein